MVDTLEFDEENHTYTVNGSELESVTKFIGSFFAPFNQEEIAQKLSDKTGRAVEEYYKEWQEARDHGTRVHKAIENYFNANSRIVLEPKDIYKYHEAIRVLDIRPAHREKELEKQIFSTKYKLAGTIDYIEYDHKMRTIALMDWKTNNKIHDKGFMGQKAKAPISELDDCAYNKYKLQLSIYAYLILEELNKNKKKPYNLEGLYLVHLLPEGRKVYKVMYEKELVEKLLKRRLKDVEKNNKKRSRRTTKKKGH